MVPAARCYEKHKNWLEGKGTIQSLGVVRGSTALAIDPVFDCRIDVAELQKKKVET